MKGSYLGSIIKLVTGNVIAQAIPLLLMPILTNYYQPEDFGMYGTYISIASVGAIIFTLRYEIAILQPKSDEDAEKIAVVSYILSVLISSSVMTITYILNIYFDFKIDLEIIFFLALGISSFSIINNYLNRVKDYNLMSVLRVVQVAITYGLPVIIVHSTPNILYLSLIISYLVLFFIFTLKYKKIFSFNGYSVNDAKILLRKYKKYPKVDLPASFLSALSLYLPTLIIGFHYDLESAGIYFLVNKLIALPMGLFSTSIGMVFRREAQSAFNSTRSFREIYLITMKKLLLLSLLISIALYLVSPFLPYLLGNNWNGTTQMINVMIPLLFVRFIASPLSFSLYIVNRMEVDFLGQIGFSLGLLGVFIIGFWGVELLDLVIILNSFNVGMYILYLHLTYKESKGKKSGEEHIVENN